MIMNIYGTNNGDILTGTFDNDIIYAYAGRDYVYGDSGDDYMNAGTGNDVINGGDGNDTLHGIDGDDTLVGSVGNDWIYGGAGNDNLYGSDGQDYLSGGAGKDTFYFESVSESSLSPFGGAYDTIADFSRVQGDKIDLSTIDANVNWWVPGPQSFSSGQLSYNVSIGVLTADVLGGDDLQVKVVGVDALPVAGFNPAVDVIG